MTEYDRDLNRRILKGNIERMAPELGPGQKERALKIAEEAFRGNIGNGEAARIGIDSVKRIDAERKD